MLVPQPFYAGYANDFPHRARGRLIPVPFAKEDGFLDLDDVFDELANVRCLEKAYRQCENDGIRVRGVLITK